MAVSRSLAFAASRMAAAPVARAAVASRSVHTEAKIKELGLELPTPAKPAANYIMCHRVGNLLFTGKRRCPASGGRMQPARAA